MTDAIVTWRQGIAFNGRGKGDADLPIGTEANDFRPLELLVMGLASCTGMDVISILEKKRQKVSAFEIKVHADNQEDCPNAFTRARMEYIVSGYGVEEAAVVRSIELSATCYCPAYAMFSKIIPIDLDYSIFEELEDGERKLTASGSYVPVAQPA
jgi:putative redox protein